jgi:hypothetical protein
MDVFRRQDDVELAVEIDDVSLAERAGNDFHRVFLDWRTALRPGGVAGVRASFVAGNILITRRFASPFRIAEDACEDIREDI